jgi:biopolymer transport protein ExbD
MLQPRRSQSLGTRPRVGDGSDFQSLFQLSLLSTAIVLLAVFIIAVPMYSDLPIVTPPAFQTGTIVDQTLTFTTVLIGSRGELFWGSQAVRDEHHLSELMKDAPQGTRIRVLADRSVSITTVHSVFRAAQHAGISEIELVRGVAVEDLRPFGAPTASR